jgi:CheY-like chemotaxis protein
MKILSVDDKAENLYMLEALLRGHGHEVDSASNGLAALDLARANHYDLIISDILMPRMDGFQLCREMKRDERLKEIPFIFYTATYTDSRDAAFALSLGADRFLVKPVDPEFFLRELSAVTAQKQARLSATAQEEPPEDEAIYLKEYNARLIAKLEKKMLDLETANRALLEDIAERERAAHERTKLEDRLRQAQKMEAIGTLAGGIAHDFNNILAGIMGFADLGLLEAQDPAAATSNFKEILRAGQRARDVIRQILSFSRHQEQYRKALSLEPAVQEALTLLRATLPASIEIVASFDAQAPAVLADGAQVHQIVTNLATNAWHAIGDRPGKIDIRLSAFRVDSDFSQTHPDLRPGRYTRLSVSDDGQGIDPAVAERIFEPFFTTKEPGRGAGLGLAVVHGIMRASDGAVTVNSQPGLGATFHLYFPALDVDAPDTLPTEPPTPMGKGERILFIDDEPVLATLGERFLTRLGYTPTVQTDAMAALAQFRDQPFDVVITDLTMPRANGIDLARRIWKLSPATRIILVTGYSATFDAAHARQLGFCEFLIKPYNLQSLGQAIHQALSRVK